MPFLAIFAVLKCALITLGNISDLCSVASRCQICWPPATEDLPVL